MGVIASLIVKIAADQAELVQGSKESVQHLDRIRESTSELSKGLVNFEGLVVRVGERMAAAFAIREVVSFVGSLASAGREARNLSLEVGAGVEKIQAIAIATRDYGMDTEQTGRAVYQLSRRIAGGDESASVAVHMLGLSLNQLKAQSPDQMLLSITDASNQLTNAQQKSVVMADLFGGKMGAALVATSGHLRETMEEVKRSGGVMDKDAVESAAHFADTIDHLTDRFKALALNGIKPAFDALSQWMDKASGSQVAGNGGAPHVQPGSLSREQAQQMYKAGQLSLEEAYFGMRPELRGGGSGSGAAASPSRSAFTIDQAKAAAGKIDPGSIPGLGLGRPLTADQGSIDRFSEQGMEAQTFMRSLKADAAKPLQGQQLEFLEELQKLGALNEKNASLMVSPGQFQKYKADIEAAKKAVEDFDAIATSTFEKQIASLERISEKTLKAYTYDGQIANLHQLMKAEEDLARATFNQLSSEKDRAKVIEDLTAREIAIKNKLQDVDLKHAEMLNTKTAEYLGLKLDGERRIAASTALPTKPQTPFEKAESDYKGKIASVEAFQKQNPNTPQSAGAIISQLNAAFVEFNDGLTAAALAARDSADAVRTATEAYERDLRIHHAGVDLTKGAFALPTAESLDKAGLVASMGTTSGIAPPAVTHTYNITVNGVMDGKSALADELADRIFRRASQGQKFGRA